MIINKKLGKLILSVFIVILCFNIFSNTIYAAINQSYKTTTNADASKLDEDMNDDETFLSMTAQVVYIITSGIEWVVSKLVGIFTTTDKFPWADKIIFNAVPMLDVNFINPSSYSLFERSEGTSTAIAEILKNLYYTVFTIGVSFFGVCVGIIALKLIFASIASQKNKYQKALFEVFKSLILLFISYYLISFLFYVNEKLVESASVILLKTLKDNNLEFQYIPEKEYNKEVVDNNANWQADQMLGTGITPKNYYNGGADNIAEKSYYTDTEWKETLVLSDESNPFRTMDNKQFIEKVTSDATASDKAYKYLFFDILSNNTLPYFDKYFNELWQGSNEADVTHLSPSNMNNIMIANLIYDVYKLNTILEKHDFKVGDNEAYKEIEEYARYEDSPSNDGSWVSYYKGKRLRPKVLIKGNGVYASNEEIVGFFKAIYDDVASRYNNNGNNKDAELLEDKEFDNNEVVLSSMGVYFKSRAYYANMVGKSGSIAASESKTTKKYNVVACVLYAIFVVQSIMYLISYFKRFFYIIILSMIAPLVIVYDFLTKAVNN